jgi:hypothetical protein
LTANPEEPNIFSPSIFWRIPGYWLFSFLSNSCRVVSASNTKRRNLLKMPDNFI